jgi:hypothetical protein
MKRIFLAALLVTLSTCALVTVAALVRADAAKPEAPPLGRYTCAPVAGDSALAELKLLSKDKYQSADQTGVYAYEAGSRKIEWPTGSIPRQLVGFYIPKGVDNAANDTIIVRDKKDVEEGAERDLWRCSLAQ